MSRAAVGGVAASRAAIASTWPRSAPSSTTALTSPIRSASSASTRSPRNSSSRALAGPTACVSTQALPWSPELPTRRKAVTKTAERGGVAQVARARERQAGSGARAVDRRHGERRHRVQQLGDLHDRAEVERRGVT